LAQFSLAQCFESGAGVVQKEGEAVKLYRQAAEQGNMHGQDALGKCYARGGGVVRSEETAVKLFRQAADQGFTEAQKYIGGRYMLGLNGVAQNFADAAHYLRLVAEKGDADALCCLGFLCEHGQGTERDLGEAVRLYRAAAAQRDVRALARLGVCLEKGRGVAQSEAEATASYAAASELGGADTFFESGVYRLNNIGEQSAPESFSLQLAVSDLALAARLGHAGAVEKLASISSRREVASVCCMGCGAARKLEQCAACCVASYCDGSCTRRMWPAHKPSCKEWRPQAAPVAE